VPPPPAGEQTGPSPDPSAPLPVDNSRAWLLSAAPILSLCLDAALLFGGYAEAAVVSTFIALAVNTIISIWDSRYVRSRGFQVSTGLAIFLVPIYLLQRAKRTRQGQALLATWITVFFLSLAGSAALSSRFVTLDLQKVQTVVQAGINQQAQTQSTVTCPDRTLYAVGATFFCDIHASTGDAHVQVKVENSSGYFTYMLVG